MVAQVLAAAAVAFLLDGYVSGFWRLAYVAATAGVILLQLLIYRGLRADRDRRQRAPLWRWRLLAVYAANAAVFGAMFVLLARLPHEPAPLLALLCIVGMVVSVALTVAAQLIVSIIVIVVSFLPAVAVLVIDPDFEKRVMGAVSIILGLLLLAFAYRLNRYFARSTELVERLRKTLLDRNRVSADAEEAQRRLRSILDTAPFPIVVVRRGDGAFLYRNRPAAELFGIDNDPAGKGVPSYMLDPVHHARIFPERNESGQAKADEELQIATAAGKVIWATLAAVPMRYAEEDAALVVVNDVTAKKESEEKLRETEQRLSDALATAPDGVALYDADERLVICNQAYARIIGVSHDVAIGMTHDEICHQSLVSRPSPERSSVHTDYPEWLRSRVHIFKRAEGEPHIFYDTRERRWLQIRDFRLTSGGTASLITDISELKARERELREANEILATQAETLAARTETLETARQAAIKAHQEAEYANRAKSQFLAHMSHELRTPLNAIIGFSEIMALRLLGSSGVPQYDRYAEDILAAGRHLLSVIDDILDLSKVEAGKMQVMAEMVPWNRLAQDCLTLLRPLAADRLVNLQVEPAPEGAALFADQRLAKQMLVNLLSNAVKYTPSGGRASFRMIPQTDGAAVVEVWDTGVGMSAADIQKALEPFGRIDSALVSQMRGTGLGLPLVKALIELHGGRMEIESVVGQGTLVRLYFPPPAALAMTG